MGNLGDVTGEPWEVEAPSEPAIEPVPDKEKEPASV